MFNVNENNYEATEVEADGLVYNESETDTDDKYSITYYVPENNLTNVVDDDLISSKVYKYGDKITFWGGISTQQTLPNGKPADVKAETEHGTAYLARNGGYIIAPAQEIQEDVPFENLCALIDSANGIV